FYKERDRGGGIVNIKQLQGKELSFNNILDLDSAFNLVKEFEDPAAVIVKHNNPCGVSEAKTLKEAFLNAYRTDPLSSFGGIVALNRKLNLETAKLILKSGFLECIIAPGFEKDAIEVFKEKKNLRIIELDELKPIEEFDFKRVTGGILLQERDLKVVDSLKVVTEIKPTSNQIKSLIFAFKVAKHLKSNAIVLAKGTKTIGIGAGQMSRLDSVIIAIRKSSYSLKGSCLASDGFFPKTDAVLKAIKAGVKAIIQPGGSIADEEVIKLCNRYRVAMVFTNLRHFRH
ncbi:MAG: bifunctional phosphoribosylaminoimidazolecarboxamide formyltransferase/IMP cyclohydrolase, partial [Candidatus Omnitrophica bacterium]|nr:bifunctional phosphoribosylaminoimidazolecarboxamide formyltransferase/IMP cyclohydrolase [Candidatus Omnitrophota bacterium]